MQRLNLTGKMFGYLKVDGLSHIQKNENHKFISTSIWDVTCKCGNKKKISGNSLTQGKTRSCGCLRKKEAAIRHKKIWVPIDNCDGSLNIPLTREMFATIDKDDYKKIKDYGWHFGPNGYASSWVNKKHVLMHCIILGLKGVDHIDHNKLNNRKLNLRPCTCVENGRNNKLNKRNSTGYRGVSAVTLTSGIKRYRVTIGRDGTCVYIGTYDSAEEAGHIAEEKRKELFGKFYNKLDKAHLPGVERVTGPVSD